mgnify:CR=1 FL=1
MKKISALMLLLVSAISLHAAEIDISLKFTETWNSAEKATQNADGSITYEAVAWGGLAAWYGTVDWSAYDKLVFEFAEKTTVNTQILIQMNDNKEEVKSWGNTGITSLECAFAGKDLTSVKQVALQLSAATTIQVKRIYLVHDMEEAAAEEDDPRYTYQMLEDRTTDDEGYETALSAVANMRIGWNLGNTLDTHSGSVDNMWLEKGNRSVTSYETGWGQPVTTRELIHMFKRAGFNAIRVPVTWYPHYGAVVLNSEGIWDKSKWAGYGINKQWMARVKEIVDYVIDEGMYCILNVHHDTGAASTTWLVAEVQEYENYKTRFETLWEKIATEFKDYGDHLLFEGYNEMLDTYNSWCFASFATPNQYDASVANSAYNAINKYAQSFVDVVRSTGGNNAYRNLIVTTYGACCGEGSWNDHLVDPLKNMKLPTDQTSGHLIFEVHSYPSIKDLNTVKASINDMINKLQTHLVSKGAPVIFGEWGPSGIDSDDYTKLHDNLMAFAQYFVEKAKDAGMGTFYWMGLSSEADRSVPRWTQGDLKDAIVKGYYGDDGYQPLLKGDVNTDGTVDISDIVAIINQIAGTGSYQLADVNSDKTVDISDIVAVINIISESN